VCRVRDMVGKCVGCMTCYVECVTMSSRTAMYAGIWFWRVKTCAR